jgi:diguanylate cyclase (GGDEF)-like protein/PAS domain S-box-containing protein
MSAAQESPPPSTSLQDLDPSEALRLSEERLTLVARATTDTVWDWDVRTNALWWGGRFREVLGLPHYTKVPHTDAFIARLHPEDRERVVASLKETVQGSADTWECEYRIRHEDGHYLWMHDRGFVIRDAQGQALRMVGGMADISERKQAAQEEAQEAQVHAELVRVQQRISSLELSLPEVLQHVAQTALEICQAEGAMLELLEGDRLVAQAAVGQMVRAPGSALPLNDSLLWPQLLQGSPVLCNDTAAQGWDFGGDPRREQVRSVLAAPLVCDDAVVGTLKATSSRTDSFSPRHLAHLQILAQSLGAMLRLRQVAAQLRESEQQYKLLFDMHPQPMWVCTDDASLRFLAVNQAMQAQYGYAAQELLRMGMADLWLPEERAQLCTEVRNYPHDQAQSGLLRRHRRKDGSVCEMEISSRGIVFNGQPARQVMATDVTERQQTQRELSRLARAQSMLGSCNEALVRASSEATLLQDVCRMVVEMGGYRLGWVGFAQNDAQRSIQIVAHAGEGSNYLEQLGPSWSEHHPRGLGPAGMTVRSGHSVIVRDVASTTLQADWAERMVGQGFHGVMALPLRAAGHTFGLLYLYAPEVLLIGTEEEALMQQLADDLAFGIMSLRARREQQQLQASVLKMAAAVSATTGAEFFVQLARNMGEALGAQVACVARLVPGRQAGEAHRVLALALVVEGKLSDSVEYALAGTPSMELLQHKQYVVQNGLSQRYPQAPIVQRVQAQAYAGQQLVDATGKPTGMIFVLFRQPLANADFVATTLQIFATRAAAEIERQATDVRVRHQASLLDKAQDAIVERDLQHRIIYWNQGAERLYGWSAAQAQGRQADTLMYGDTATFEHATTTVLTRGEWSGEISVRHQQGHTIEAEGRWTLVLDDKGRPESILEINTDIRQRKAKDREIQRLAFYDTLTGLPNRMLLLDRMQHALDNAKRQQQGGALLFIDLDNFKTLNDTLGHDKGDLLLQQVAQRLNTCVRSVDTVARLGGDEFVVMLEGLSEDAQALALEAQGVGEKILAQLAQPYALAGYHYRSTPSIGIVPFQGPQTSVLELLKQADLAMYQAKSAGRNTLRFFDPEMQAAVSARASLEDDLRHALAFEQFLLHFQPQVDQKGRFVGVEALVRWHHPERGLVSPAQFIPVAEETGLILALGRWVLHSACKLLARWKNDPQLGHLTMAVNVSSQQFHHESFVDDVARALAVNDVPADRLKLELTESLMVEDVDITVATMTTLRTLGVRFSLDDFGTGYSSLSYLKRLPLDQLKIDQSFVRDLFSDPNDAAIINTIIALGQTLGLEVIAEGVETTEQHLLLVKAGCPAFQGYLFSKPIPAGTLERLLRLPVNP